MKATALRSRGRAASSETAARPPARRCPARGTQKPAPALMRRLGRHADRMRRPAGTIRRCRRRGRFLRARLQRRQHQQRHDHGARPIGDLVEMERQPHRQQHDLDRQHRHAAPGQHPEHRQQEAGEDVAVDRAAARADRLARPHHMRRIDEIADHLQREIGLHASRSCRRRRRAPAASRHARPGRGADNWRSCLPARHRPARPDNGAAAHIPPGWCRRPPARTPSARRTAA